MLGTQMPRWLGQDGPCSQPRRAGEMGPFSLAVPELGGSFPSFPPTNLLAPDPSPVPGKDQSASYLLQKAVPHPPSLVLLP